MAIELALIACGVAPGSKVLVPGFTFTAVPSAIVMLHAIPVFVECTEDYRLDIDDLRRKITSETRVLLLSHMRGHISDMDAITELCTVHGVTLIEDAAHALGARWRGRQIGSFGKAGCFSFQSNKVINAGEGGMLTTDDEEIIVKAIYLSGAYEMNYKKHFANGVLFEKFADRLPAHNARMTNLTAAVARPQIKLVDAKGKRYREMYAYLKRELTATNRIAFPEEYPQEERIPDSVQFTVLGYDAARCGTSSGECGNGACRSRLSPRSTMPGPSITGAISARICRTCLAPGRSSRPPATCACPRSSKRRILHISSRPCGRRFTTSMRCSSGWLLPDGPPLTYRSPLA